MHPTNNLLAERLLRKVVIFHRIRYGVYGKNGMKTFSTLMTCFMTWQRRGLTISGRLRGVLKPTDAATAGLGRLW